jgi:beta-glucanase (GH16 family)
LGKGLRKKRINKTLQEEGYQGELDKEKRQKSLQKNAAIKKYYKIKASALYKLYEELKDSDELNNFKKLEAFCLSGDLTQLKAELKEKHAQEKAKPAELKKLAGLPEVKQFLNNGEGEKTKNIEEYEALNEYLNSGEFKENLQNADYSNSGEYKKEQEYLKLKKDARLKKYFKFENSTALQSFNRTQESAEFKELNELTQYISSNEYKEKLEGLKWENSEGFAKEKELEQLNNDENIKHWLKFQKDKQYLVFKEVEGSELLEEYQLLKEYVDSSGFAEEKSYLLDKQKYQKTQEYKDEERLKELENSEDIKWYFKVKDSNKFDSLQAWRLTFEEEFELGKIDQEKWMNAFFWGKMLMDDRYVMAGDKAYFTDNKNLEFNGTTVKIVAKNEKVSGKVWHPQFGFNQQDFDYTSGMLSTAHSFRQQYGKFEAKIKINSTPGFYQAFWLKGEKIVPEIDVVKFNMGKNNRMQFSVISGDAKDYKNAKNVTTKFGGGSFSKDFFIYTLEWGPEKISWKINHQEVYSTSENIPKEPMYLMLSAGLQNNAGALPAGMEIDWVRVYERNE